MTDNASETNKDVEALRRALSRWDNEGGAAPQDPQLRPSMGTALENGT